MAAAGASPAKKKSPTKKKKIAVKADYGGVYFGEQPPETPRGQADTGDELAEPEDDPLIAPCHCSGTIKFVPAQCSLPTFFAL